MSDPIEKKIHYTFSDPLLLETALTHASLQGIEYDNERLEFLGDRVLGLVIADMLYSDFSAEDEGSLAKRHAALVGRDALAKAAQVLDLSNDLKLSPSEMKSGGHKKETILADAMEALIGAIYLDGGIFKATDFIKTYWRGMINLQETPPADAKSLLQEWAQGKGMALPQYKMLNRSGTDHAPQFEIEVLVEGVGRATATAATKRAAEKAAAVQMLEKIGVIV